MASTKPTLFTGWWTLQSLPGWFKDEDQWSEDDIKLICLMVIDFCYFDHGPAKGWSELMIFSEAPGVNPHKASYLTTKQTCNGCMFFLRDRRLQIMALCWLYNNRSPMGKPLSYSMRARLVRFMRVNNIFAKGKDS